MRRILLVAAVVVVGLVAAITVVVTTRSSGADQPTALVKPMAAVTYTPVAGAQSVDPTKPASLAVTGGSLKAVKLADGEGAPVDGKITPDGAGWASTAPLRYGATYTWTGTVAAADGSTTPLQGGFTTAKPTKTVRGTLNIGDGRTVGVAAPIRIQFNSHVEDRAAVERVLTVTSTPEVEGSWGWLPDEGGGSRVDFRTKEYWPANTEVTVEAKLKGVDYGGGAVGAADVTSTFTIGRSQIVKADVTSFRMVVVRDGQQVMDFPASYGLGSDPERNTRSGIHVVSEKFTDKRMVSQQYDYDVMEKWAVRISNNGEFIHANPVSEAAQGSSNVTHGCVNLSVDNAKAYYDTALYGDPVEVTGTPVKLASRDGDIWDWTLDWNHWQGLSALK